MCDYSLAAMQTRLAVEGEQLSVYHFPSGSRGLTSPAELERCKPELRGWRSWFNPRQTPCAVCIPPGAQLLLRGVQMGARQKHKRSHCHEKVEAKLGVFSRQVHRKRSRAALD